MTGPAGQTFGLARCDEQGPGQAARPLQGSTEK